MHGCAAGARVVEIHLSYDESPELAYDLTLASFVR